MFNKTTIINKTRLINHSENKFRKTLPIKLDNIVNLKNSVENNNKTEYTSENNSNINIKSTAQSNLVSDTSTIPPIQKKQNIKIKNKFFSEEKKNKNKTKTINSIESLKQSDKNKNELKFYKINNLKQNKFFFRKNNNKNEMIQVESDNYKNTNDFRNIFQEDQKIDKMAKKLVLKLNEDEYYDREKSFKSFFGNNITLKNGFFNGTNLVLNNQDDEKIENQSINSRITSKNFFKNRYSKNLTNLNLDTSNSITNKTQSSFQLNKYSNLPLFLREKANIQGTEILSPFCKEARDEFLFNKIFNVKFNRPPQKRFEIINNKLNILYAENEKQYISRLKKLNKRIKLKGRKLVHQIGPTKDQVKLDNIKTTLSFIKKIFDYSYPNMILSKVRKVENYGGKRSLTENNIPPYKRAELLEKEKNNILGQYLKMSIDIQNN